MVYTKGASSTHVFMSHDMVSTVHQILLTLYYICNSIYFICFISRTLISKSFYLVFYQLDAFSLPSLLGVTGYSLLFMMVLLFIIVINWLRYF